MLLFHSFEQAHRHDSKLVQFLARLVPFLGYPLDVVRPFLGQGFPAPNALTVFLDPECVCIALPYSAAFVACSQVSPPPTFTASGTLSGIDDRSRNSLMCFSA